MFENIQRCMVVWKEAGSYTYAIFMNNYILAYVFRMLMFPCDTITHKECVHARTVINS